MTYSWSTVAAWESDNGDTADSDGDPAIPFTSCDLPGGADFAESGAGIGTGMDVANFDGEYNTAGYYIVEVQCTANIHDSSTGQVINSLSAVGYIGGSASDVGEGGDTAHAMTANADDRGSGGDTGVAKGMEVARAHIEMNVDPICRAEPFWFLWPGQPVYDIGLLWLRTTMVEV